MPTFTIAHLKGGVGKTTTTVHLGTVLAHRGPTLIGDADAQGSTTRWIQDAQAEDPDMPADVVVCPWPNLDERLARTKANYEFIVLDTPTTGDKKIVEAAMRAADLVIIPCPAAVLAVDQLIATVALAREVGTPYKVLLTMTDLRARARVEVRHALEVAGRPTFRIEIPRRQEIEDGAKQPVDVHRTPYRYLVDELLPTITGEPHESP